MEKVPCIPRGTFFIPRNRKQNYCSFPECQKDRRASWLRNKLQTDREYRENQRISNTKWLQNNPGYWKEYRRNNPDKADRNMALQKVRNYWGKRGPGALCFLNEIKGRGFAPSQHPYNMIYDFLRFSIG